MAANTLSDSSTHAPQPAPPQRQYSFTDFQVNNPTSPPPGDRLDGEYDRTNKAVADTIAWASVSLNSDGSLKPQTIGKSQFTQGLFDHIEADAVAVVQPLVDEVQDHARAAGSAAVEADASALAAARQNDLAQAAAQAAVEQAQDAGESAAAAGAAVIQAQAIADQVSNDDEHATLAANTAEDWAQVSIEWAEHMPDTIPPNILAISAITGEHWSSRWWAHQAHLIVENDTAEAICEIQNYWMGAYSSPPTQNTCGDPVAQGAMYYDLTDQTTKVFDGTTWHPVVQPVPGNADQFLYLPSTPTSIFSGVDHFGKTLAFSSTASEVLVYLNGVKQLETLDYTLGTNSVSFILSAIGPPNTVQIVVIGQVPVVLPPVPGALKVDTNAWVFNGVTVAFPLKDAAGNTITPPSAVDCVVSLNGVIQEAGADYSTGAGTITFTTAPQADASKWMLVGLPIQTNATAVDSSIWVFDGVATSFPIKNSTGQPLNPAQATACLVSLNGVIQEPGADYTIVPGFIQFSQPPQADADAWMVVSLAVVST